MDVRKLLTSVGGGITTFLLVTVVIIELLDMEFSAIIALPIGLLVGLAVLAGIWISIEEMGPGVQRATSAYASFGLVLLALLGLRYVNVGRNVLTFDVVVGVSLATAVVVFLGLFASERGVL